MLEALQMQATASGGVAEHDFVVTLATAQGHTVPEGARAFHCQGCQATLLTAKSLSTHCPYCGSPHVIETEARAMIEPEGVIPFGVEASTANHRFHAWLADLLGDHDVRTTRVRGLYVPLWTFDLMGEVKWHGVEPSNRSQGPGLGFTLGGGTNSGYGGKRTHTGTHYVIFDDLVVPASHKVPYDLVQVYEGFDLSGVVAYDTRYLSDWPADVYDVAVGDASLVARRRALDRASTKARVQAEAAAGHLQQFRVVPNNLSVQAYKLLFVPVYIANYRYEGETYTVVVNGQTGDVEGEQPPGRLKRLLGGLLGTGT
jgi:hypothetical protein